MMLLFEDESCWECTLVIHSTSRAGLIKSGYRLKPLPVFLLPPPSPPPSPPHPSPSEAFGGRGGGGGCAFSLFHPHCLFLTLRWGLSIAKPPELKFSSSRDRKWLRYQTTDGLPFFLEVLEFFRKCRRKGRGQVSCAQQSVIAGFYWTKANTENVITILSGQLGRQVLPVVPPAASAAAIVVSGASVSKTESTRTCATLPWSSWNLCPAWCQHAGCSVLRVVSVCPGLSGLRELCSPSSFSNGSLFNLTFH